MSSLKMRLLKLEQSNDVAFDMLKPLSEWSFQELKAYQRFHNPNYIPPDYSKLTLDELRVLRADIQNDKLADLQNAI